MPAFHLAQTNLVGRSHWLGLLLATFLVHLATTPAMATQDAQAEPTESLRRLNARWDYRWGDVPVTGAATLGPAVRGGARELTKAAPWTADGPIK